MEYCYFRFFDFEAKGIMQVQKLILVLGFCFVPLILVGQGQTIGAWRDSQQLPSLPAEQTEVDPEQEKKDMDLLVAVFENRFDDVVEGIEQGAHVNARDYEGLTTLMYALYNADDEIIDHLLHMGADLNSIDLSGTSVLMHAILAGKDRFIMENLYSFGAVNHRNKDGYTALVFVAQEGDLSLAEALVNIGANIHYSTDTGTTPLIHAAAFGNFYLVDFLAFSGAVVNHRANDGSTALHMAAYYGHNDVAGLLLSWGANSELKDNRGNTPLMSAIYGYQLETVWYLVESGASLHTQNDSGLTPLRLATWLEDFEMVELILNYEFEEPEFENKRSSALAYSFFNRNRPLQKKLMQRSGISPRGLYFSELSVYQGLDFNNDDRMYNASVGLFESRYRMLIRLDFMTRLSAQEVFVPHTANYIFRFFESRNVWLFGLQHEIVLYRTHGTMMGVMPGAAVSWSQAQYRGTGMHPPEGFAVRPVADVFFHVWNFTLSAGYQYWDTGQKDISPHRFRMGLAYRFPLLRRGVLSYRPVLR